jgi:hypothetical protein
VRRNVRRGHFVTALLTVATALTVSACGGSKPQSKAPPKPVTERQRDSAIGASGLPGASGIRRAQQVTDSLNAQNARLDSIH